MLSVRIIFFCRDIKETLFANSDRARKDAFSFSIFSRAHFLAHWSARTFSQVLTILSSMLAGTVLLPPPRTMRLFLLALAGSTQAALTEEQGAGYAKLIELFKNLKVEAQTTSQTESANLEDAKLRCREQRDDLNAEIASQQKKKAAAEKSEKETLEAIAGLEKAKARRKKLVFKLNIVDKGTQELIVENHIYNSLNIIRENFSHVKTRTAPPEY